MFPIHKMFQGCFVICGRRILVSMLVFGMMLPIIIFLNKTQELQREPKIRSCYMDADPLEGSSLTSLEDVLLSDEQPSPGRTIFFHETKCHSPDYIVNLTARQACAIESAALHNPNFQVFVLFAGPTYMPQSDQKLPLLDAILSYKNVHLRQLNLWRYGKDTPVEDWLKNGDLLKSRFLTEHTSDLLRLMSLYRYGGIYMDIDVVVLRSLEYVPLNYVGAHDTMTLGNAVISLDSRGSGHEIAELFLEDYKKNYNGDVYVGNGPSLITRMAAKICGTRSVQKMQEDRTRCRGLQVYNSSAFFPLRSEFWRHYFEPQYLNDTIAKTKDAYLIHVWNRSSYKGIMKTGASTAYLKYAEEHCPKVYAAAGEYF